MKYKIFATTLVTVIIIILSGCVKGIETPPTALSPILNTPENLAKELLITTTSSFVDINGIYHLVGEVFNNTEDTFNSIDLTVEIMNADGSSMLLDENGNTAADVVIHPLLYSLAPGSSSPFEYTYETVNGTPATYSVQLTGKQSSTSNSVSLQIENVQLMDNGTNWFYLTGKLVNTSNQWVHINALAGGILDDTNTVLSANWTSTYTTELAPSGDAQGRDWTPFQINFPNPGGGTHWKIYQDANIAESVSDFPLGVEITNSYLDQYGVNHLVGWISNSSNQPLDSLVVAGLYSADGTVLDAGYASVPLVIKPGTAAPFSISSFESLNRNPNLVPLVTAKTAQYDPWFSYVPPSETVDMVHGIEDIQKDGATWIVTGSFTNDSGKEILYATVAVMVIDAQSKLIAMEYASIYPATGAITPGETMAYSITMHLDQSADTSVFQTATVIQGAVK